MAKTKGATTKQKVERNKRVVTTYDQQTINKCFRLYLRYNGKQYRAIGDEMRREYPWFKDNRISAWAEKYAWDAALKVKIESDKRQALTTADELVEEVETVRKKIYERIKGDGNHDDDLIARHRDYCRLSIEALTRVQEARDTFGAWLAFWEKMLEWVPEFSPHAAQALLQVSDALIERAAKEYGTGEEEDEAREADD